MTRLAALADIHGNLPALEAVLDDLEGWRPDAIVHAGDAVCWGPRSREVLERLAAVGATGVRGNNEYYLLDGGTARMPESWRHYGLIPPLIEDVGPTWRDRIAAWPDAVSLRFPDGPPIHLCHGRPGDPWNGLYDDEPVPPSLLALPEPIVLTAHIHLAMDARIGTKRVVNPGAVGVPLDGDRRAAYARLEATGDDWHVEFRRVAYDLDALERDWAATRFLERNGPMATLVMREFRTARLTVVPFLRFRAEEMPNATEGEALARFDDAARLRHTPPRYRRPLQ